MTRRHEKSDLHAPELAGHAAAKVVHRGVGGVCPGADRGLHDLRRRRGVLSPSEGQVRQLPADAGGDPPGPEARPTAGGGPPAPTSAQAAAEPDPKATVASSRLPRLSRRQGRSRGRPRRRGRPLSAPKEDLRCVRREGKLLHCPPEAWFAEADPVRRSSVLSGRSAAMVRRLARPWAGERGRLRSKHEGSEGLSSSQRANRSKKGKG
jgi:hypothetical protein